MREAVYTPPLLSQQNFLLAAYLAAALDMQATEMRAAGGNAGVGFAEVVTVGHCRDFEESCTRYSESMKTLIQ